MKAQTKRDSLVEAVTVTLIGFVLAVVTNWYVLPWFGFAVSWSQSFWITVVFTVIGVIRIYLVRRAFNWYQERQV